MANGTGNPGIQSKWEDGDLVFQTRAGVEVLRLSATGVLSIAGLTFPVADGTANQVLATDGAGNLFFKADAVV